jgi:hypothetical protein
MPKAAEPELIESTAGQVAAELSRRGVTPEQRVTIAIEPDEPNDWLSKTCKFARAKVAAEGWSDEDIDRIIKEERKAIQPQIG